MSTMTSEREAFETSVRQWPTFKDSMLAHDGRHPDYYGNPVVQGAWEGWKARTHLAQPAQAVDVGADFGAMNSALCAFAMRWEIDGDYMRCLKCKRPQITNYASHDFPHAHDCKAAGKVEARPWETFAQLLSPLTRALSGEKAGPVGDGWDLVPCEPTQEMLDAFQEELCRWSALTRVDDAATAALWKSMLAANKRPPEVRP